MVAGGGRKADLLTGDAVWWTQRQAFERRRAPSTLQLLIDGQIMVDTTQQSLVAERELVAGNQLTAARHAPETVDVVDVTARSHHQVGHAEAELAAGTLGTKQSTPEPVNQLSTTDLSSLI